MQQTNILIIGASISGLATAACLRKKGIEFIIIEREEEVAAPWRKHYDRLHLHTNKSVSNLPYKKFDKKIGRYPSRINVIEYLDSYRKEFQVNPLFGTEATSVKKEGDRWMTKTNKGTIKSNYVIAATGPFSLPKIISIKGMQAFPGRILHSYNYKTGSDFMGQKVLVIGFGNSACEIAIDLYEQGAMPSMSVRSPVNVIPRDLFCIPILKISLLMSKLPTAVADAINAPVIRLMFGDILKLGLRKKPYGAFTQIKKELTIPVIDIGTIKHIRKGHISIYGGIDHIEGNSVQFADGRKETFDAIVAAIGYYPNHSSFIDIDQSRFEDLKVPVSRQKYFGKDGLYFCGFWISPTGQIREIASDAGKIAKDIAKKEAS